MTKILSKRKRKEAERLSKNKGVQECSSCHTMHVVESMIYGPNPFVAEIYDSQAIVKIWLCKKCYEEICDDI